MSDARSAQTEARQVRMGAGDYSLVLPGTWAAIPLADETVMKKSIAALVKRQLGGDDRIARRRIQLRNELVETAQKAAAEGALSFSLSMELLPGVPFPAAMMGKRRPWPDVSAGTPQRERLAAAFPGATVLPLDSGDWMARVATSETQRYVEQTTPSLTVEYWIVAPDSDLLYLTISAPMVPEAELFVELFDLIAASLTWDIDVARSVIAIEDGLGEEPRDVR